MKDALTPEEKSRYLDIWLNGSKSEKRKLLNKFSGGRKAPVRYSFSQGHIQKQIRAVSVHY